MIQKDLGDDEAAEIIALKALTFLAEDSERLQAFLALSGLSPEEIRRNAGSRALLGGVLDHLCGDESLLLVFAEQAGIEPALIAGAARRLTGDRP